MRGQWCAGPKRSEEWVSVECRALKRHAKVSEQGIYTRG